MDKFHALARPFHPDELRWRQQGKVSARNSVQLVVYIDARAVMDRLDEVIGPDKWQCSYRPGADGGLICRIDIWITDEDGTNGRWCGKEDGAENTQIEAVKGGMSDAFKRAGVKWGIARYLYRMPDKWHNVNMGDRAWANGHGVDIQTNRKHVGWVPFPQLPPFALPPQDQKESPSEAEVRRAKHDTGWENGGRGRFMAQLAELAKRHNMPIAYETIKWWRTSRGKSKPSHMSGKELDGLIIWLDDNPAQLSSILQAYIDSDAS